MISDFRLLDRFFESELEGIFCGFRETAGGTLHLVVGAPLS
jgi:hypothetical protein